MTTTKTTVKRHRPMTLTWFGGVTATSCADCGQDLYRRKGQRIWSDYRGNRECTPDEI